MCAQKRAWSQVDQSARVSHVVSTLKHVPGASLLFRPRKYLRTTVVMMEHKLYSRGILSTKNLTLPQFLIIGPPRAATTWLKDNLKRHPEVFIPNGEPEYFTKYFDRRRLKSYSKIFQKCSGRVAGEKSPTYCTLPSERIRYIDKIMPNLVIFFMMRDPIDRVWSDAIKSGFISSREPGHLNESEAYAYFSQEKEKYNYSKILERWLRVFPPERFNTCFLDEIVNHPKNVLIQVFRNLGISEEVDWNTLVWDDKRGLGPNIPIPPRYRELLEQLYFPDIESLRQRFGSRMASW